MCIQKLTSRAHLTQEDRAVIEALRAQGETLRAIASVIHKHYSTISCELRRNRAASGMYTARYAHKQCALRRSRSKYGSRIIENDAELERHIEKKLRGKHERGDWSPAVIAHFNRAVCHQTIYAWIRRSRSDLRRLLPRAGRYRRKYGSRKAPSRGWTTKIRSIETRPDEIKERKTIGHFEGDTILLGRLFRILTLVDRKSRFLVADLLPEGVGIAYSIHEALVARLTALPSTHRFSLTNDRGGEFAYWDMAEGDIEGLSISRTLIPRGSAGRTNRRTACFDATFRRKKNTIRLLLHKWQTWCG